MTNLDSTHLDIDHEGEVQEVFVEYGTWVARDAHGNSFVDFEIYTASGDVDLPDDVVRSALADCLNIPLPDTIGWDE